MGILALPFYFFTFLLFYLYSTRKVTNYLMISQRNNINYAIFKQKMD